MRFTTNALIDLEARIASAADRALALELDAFERLRQACLAEARRLRGFGAALAEIDVAAALAELAVKRDWTRPAGRRFARLPDRGRAPSGGRGGAESTRASRSSPTTAISPATSARAGASRS